jgi:hypothetical protein
MGVVAACVHVVCVQGAPQPPSPLPQTDWMSNAGGSAARGKRTSIMLWLQISLKIHVALPAFVCRLCRCALSLSFLRLNCLAAVPCPIPTPVSPSLLNVTPDICPVGIPSPVFALTHENTSPLHQATASSLTSSMGCRMSLGGTLLARIRRGKSV